MKKSEIQKNIASILRGVGEVTSITLKTLPTAGQVIRIGVSVGVKVVSWIFLPVTCIGFGTWSLVKTNNDCKTILNIFYKAFTYLKYKTLVAYIESFRDAISYLKTIGEKIIKEDEEEEEVNVNKKVS